MREKTAEHGFKDFVLDQLRTLDGLEARAMFGGWGLYRDRAFFGIVYKGSLYFKVSEASRAEYERAGMKPFQPAPGKTMKSFYALPPDVLESREHVVEWAEAACKAAQDQPKKVRNPRAKKSARRG